MRDALHRSERHAGIDTITEPMTWARPSARPSILAASPVCDCGKGRQGRIPCPTPVACLLSEPEEPKDAGRYDSEGRMLLRWLIAVPTLVLIVGLVAAFWPAGWSVL